MNSKGWNKNVDVEGRRAVSLRGKIDCLLTGKLEDDAGICSVPKPEPGEKD